MAQHWDCTWIGGVDCGATVRLGPGRHIIGRSRTVAVRSDDPNLEPHHALLEIRDDGSARLTQLTGRHRVTLDERPIDGLTIELAGTAGSSTIEIGHSLLHCRPTSEPAHMAAVHVVNDTVVRGPRSVPRFDPVALSYPIPPPERDDAPGGLVPAVLALAGAGAIALVLHQPMFLLFGALGGLVALGSWGAQFASSRRRAKRARRAHRSAVAEFDQAMCDQRRAAVAYHRSITSTAARAATTIVHRTVDLWARRREHDDAFIVSLGVGPFMWQPHVDDAHHTDAWAQLEHSAEVADQPTALALAPGTRLAVRGDTDITHSIARSIVVQLAAGSGPADVRFVVATQQPTRWEWMRDLPHLRSADGSVALGDESAAVESIAALMTADGCEPHVVVVTDDVGWLTTRTSPLRRAVTGDRPCALIALVPAQVPVPHLCSCALTIGRSPIGRWTAHTRGDRLPEPVRAAGMGERTAAALVQRIAGLRDPEDPFHASSALPRSVRLLDLLDGVKGRRLHPATIASAWREAGPDPAPRVPIGVAADGTVDIDLVRDGPHALLAGTTGAGKSELLRSLVAGLCLQSSPDHLTLLLIDYKGGSTFDGCAALPHVVGLVTDLDEHLAERALRSLHAELRRRESAMREHGAADLASLRSLRPDVTLPRLVVVIDEFAALVQEQPQFLHALVGVAQRGRSLGVHLLLATQRPNGVISDDIRANTNLRIALRMHDASDAMDVVGEPSPAHLPRGLPGRAVMRLGPDECVTFQTAHCADDLGDITRAIREAVVIGGIDAPRRPWLPPLPGLLPHGAEGLGVIDDPDQQTTTPLNWNRADGHLVLAGAPSTGLTTALVALGADVVAASAATQLFVIDASGAPELALFENHPRCAGVVRLHERERLMRLLHRLAGQVRTRMTAGQFSDGRPPGDSDVVLLVDGFTQLRHALDELDTMTELDTLDRLLVDGPNVGLVAALTTCRPTALPAALLALCAQRWVFHLAEPLDAQVLGVTASQVPSAIAGRLVVATCGRHAQLALPPAEIVVHPNSPSVERIECLPATIDAVALRPHARATDGATLLPIGLQFADSQPAVIELPDGDHLLIVGPSRSGRSTTLRRAVAAWRQVHPRGWVGSLTPRHVRPDLPGGFESLDEILGALPGDGPVLVAIDDAELIDDPTGALAALLTTRSSGFAVMAAGRPDALRQAYGHWTGVVRRSRLAVVMAASTELDGDLVGTTLPRRVPIAHRPGLAWLVGNGELTLVQVATDAITGSGRPPAQSGVDPASSSSSAIKRLGATIR